MRGEEMSLAITEKQRQRPGGCAGIFFQLLDWNRRLAKKKLFTHKFLSPVRDAKMVNKKLGRGDVKMPVANKLLLIAHENRGGFPVTKKPEDAEANGDGMRAPTLVARLMGLESMPEVNHMKPPRKASGSERSDHVRGGTFYEYRKQDLSREVGGQGRSDSRPQKLQKTGDFLERRVTGPARFSPEVLGKSVLSRTKKQRHVLASPAKSPQLLSRSGTARLLQAASKILEPGLQSRNRARCALTYTGSLRDNAGTFGAASSPNISEVVHMSDSTVGSWTSSDSLVVSPGFRLDSREPLVTKSEPSPSDYSNVANAASSSQDGSVDGKTKTSPISSRRVRNSESLAVQGKLSVQSKGNDFTGRKHCSCKNQDQCKPWQEVNSRPTLENKQLRQNQWPLARDREVHPTRACNRKQSGNDTAGFDRAKNSVTLNRNLSDYSRTRPAANLLNNHRVETGRSGWDKTSAPKRRPASATQTENVVGVNTTSLKQRSGRTSVRTASISQKRAELISSRSVNRNYAGSQLPKKADGGSPSGSKNNGIVSFTFSSPMRQGSTSSTHQEMKQKNRAHGELTCSDSCSKLASDTNAERSSLQGDELSHLLEQKIKQLTSLDREDLETVNAPQARATVTILEELISALATESPTLLNGGNSCSSGSTLSENSCRNSEDLSDCTISQNQMLTMKEKSKDDAKASISASCLVSDSDRPSPMSILEASFSNDSCSGGSPCSSGGKPHHEFIESCRQTHKLDFDTDLSDSATSTKDLDNAMIPHSFDKRSIMNSSCLREAGVSEAKLSHVSEAISNAQLLFVNISLCQSDGTLGLSVVRFLLSILETTLDAFRINPKGNLEFVKEEILLRDLLIDCIIECLNSKYDCFCKSGYKAWSNLSVLLHRDWLLREVNKEIRGWGELAGRVLDDVIEKEISLSAPKWTQFDIEGFETSIEIENEILEALVDEMVIDMCSC